MPGNFFMISVDRGLDPLLKRPFSIHRWLDGDFQLLYRVTGRGTAILSKKKNGDVLEGIGPLGKGFPVKAGSRKIILVAGGLGIAPVFNLAEHTAKNKPLFFYGVRTKREALCLDGVRSLGIDPFLSSDDGTLGARGTVVSNLKKYLKNHSASASRIVLYSCGPEAMLRALSLFAKDFGAKGYVALEQNMACGIGTCLGCVVQTKKGYKRVCKEGPVFPMEEIIW